MITLLKLPRSLIYKSLRRGYIRLNSTKSKPCGRIKSEDIISVRKHLINTKKDNYEEKFLPEASRLSWLTQSILFENNDFLVINKPSGLAVHGGSGQSQGLIELIRHLRVEDKFSYELIHRLDKDTSGLLVIAKKRSALREISSLFANREVKKNYYTVVEGNFGQRITCQFPLKTIRCQDQIRRAIVDEQEGKPCHSVFIPHYTNHDYTLFKVELKTGRMHQIRSHACTLNMPIVGDKLYNKCDKKKLHLHAFQLKFKFKEENYEFLAPLPENWVLSELLKHKDGPWNLKTKK